MASQTIDFDDHVLADPFSTYARLRATPGLLRHAREGYHLVARYDDVREAAMRTEDFSSRIVDVLVRSARLPRWAVAGVDRLGPVDVLAVEDAPRHPVHRKLATRHFGRDPVARALELVSDAIDQRVDGFVRVGGGDFMADVAGVIPVTVALTILGLPRGDGAQVKRLTDRSVALLSGVLPRHERTALVASGLELYAYSLARFLQHRREGTGEPLFDAIAAASRAGDVGLREAASIVMQVLIAGSDSTASLLGSAVRILADRPDLETRLREDAALVPSFLEEVLRLESPFQGHFRVARRDTSLGGTRVAAGDRLMLLWASANRDETVYARAADLDLARRRGDRPHLAFGQGSHLCLGAGLARGVARTVLERLLARTSRIERRERGLEYARSGFVRTLSSLPLRVAPRVAPARAA